MADLLRARNPKVEIYLMATWSRADQIYPAASAWAGQPIESMARDVRAHDKAAAGAPGVIGDSGRRGVDARHPEGVADSNPYDGIEAGKLNLWTYDHYHGSTYGYYLEALVIFGALTGRDPRSLGDNECSACSSASLVRRSRRCNRSRSTSSRGWMKPAPLVQECRPRPRLYAAPRGVEPTSHRL